MSEKTSLGLVEIILHFILTALCIGVLAGAIATISTVNDAEIFDDDAEAVVASTFDNPEEDGDRFRGVAWWLLCLGIGGIISQSVMFFIRLLYYNVRIESLFIVFGILALILTAFLTLGLFVGGVYSAVNAADVTNDYLDKINCEEYDPSDDSIRELCSDLEEVRSSQVSAAVVALLGSIVGGLLTLTILGSTLTRGKELA